jgi:hypothetical protein
MAPVRFHVTNCPTASDIGKSIVLMVMKSAVQLRRESEVSGVLLCGAFPDWTARPSVYEHTSIAEHENRVAKLVRLQIMLPESLAIQ